MRGSPQGPSPPTEVTTGTDAYVSQVRRVIKMNRFKQAETGTPKCHDPKPLSGLPPPWALTLGSVLDLLLPDDLFLVCPGRGHRGAWPGLLS